MTEDIQLSIVVPAYDEEETIAEALRRINRVTLEHGIVAEIILVIDGRVDQTQERAEELQFENIKIVSYERNQGKGFALREGTRHVRGRYTAFLDADLDIDATSLIGLYRQLQRDRVHAVVGSKVHRDSRVEYPLFRRFQSLVMRKLVKTLFSLDIGDTQTGIKVFETKSLLDSIESVKTKGFSFDVDLLVQMHDSGCVISEGPVILNFQFTSTVGFTSAVTVLRDLVALRIQRTRRIQNR